MNSSDSPAIVVAVEPGQPDAVLLQASALAAGLGCRLVCAHVDRGRYPVEQRGDGSVVSLPFDPDLPEMGDDEFDPDLAAHVDRVLGRTGVPYAMRVLAGDPARALARLADTLDARLIVVGTHQPGLRRGVRDFFNGSVAVHLAHRQPRPVVVVPLTPVTDEARLPWE
jgi:nucleotide-binding universal stress UspA family protein